MLVCSWVWSWVLVRKNGWCIMIAVFDLDGTVLDSSHRALINENGGINIEEWRSHTAEQILNDSELPLADYMRFCISSPEIRTWICTSRHLQNADKLLLQKLGLYDVDLIYREIKTITAKMSLINWLRLENISTCRMSKKW